MAFKEITKEELENLDNNGFTVLFLYGDGIVNSRTVQSKLKGIATEDETLNILKFITSFDNRDLVKRFKINLLPALVILEDNEVLATKSGLSVVKSKKSEVIPQESILNWINSFRKEEEE